MNAIILCNIINLRVTTVCTAAIRFATIFSRNLIVYDCQVLMYDIEKCIEPTWSIRSYSIPCPFSGILSAAKGLFSTTFV